MKKRILVVDDERSILELLDFKFSKRGFEVITARNVKEFQDRALSQQFDLIILDIWLGGWIGTQVYAELLDKGLDRRIPVIFITALLEEQTGSQRSGGRYALYRKPFDFSELMKEIDRMLKEYVNDERRDSDEKSNLLDIERSGDSGAISFDEPGFAC